jgi:putative membrane protein
MDRLALLAAALVIASPVAAQSVGERTGINAALGRAPATADFVGMAAVSDMFEIESSKLAQQKADAASKAFAAKMVADHSKTSSELKSLAQRAKVEVPKQMDSAHQQKLDKLKGLSGDNFDSEYDSMQVQAHEDAVSLFERYAKGGENAGLKQFATKTLPHLQQHLKMARELK